MSGTMPGADGDVPIKLDGFLRMQLAARTAHVRLVRLVGADLAAQLEFDLEMISEFQMATEEACGQLVTVAAPDAMLYCEFRQSDRELSLLVSTITLSSETRLSESSFGWRVLREFTDTVAQVRGAAARQAVTAEPAGCWLGIRLGKRDMWRGLG